MDVKPYSIEELIKKPAHYLRLGHSNWLSMDGVTYDNCDGHPHDLPGLKEDQRKIVREPKPGIIYGITPSAVKDCLRAVRKYPNESIPWYDGDIWKNAFEARNMRPFMEFSREKSVFLVGPRHLYTVPVNRRFYYRMKVPCYLQKEALLQAIRSINKSEYDVILFAASVLSSSAIYALHEELKGKWLIDVGAGLDPAGGVRSRAFHNQATMTEIRDMFGIAEDTPASEVESPDSPS